MLSAGCVCRGICGDAVDPGRFGSQCRNLMRGGVYLAIRRAIVVIVAIAGDSRSAAHEVAYGCKTWPGTILTTHEHDLVWSSVVGLGTHRQRGSRCTGRSPRVLSCARSRSTDPTVHRSRCDRSTAAITSAEERAARAPSGTDLRQHRSARIRVGGEHALASPPAPGVGERPDCVASADDRHPASGSVSGVRAS
jgi:hypothetical protein